MSYRVNVNLEEATGLGDKLPALGVIAARVESAVLDAMNEAGVPIIRVTELEVYHS